MTARALLSLLIAALAATSACGGGAEPPQVRPDSNESRAEVRDAEREVERRALGLMARARALEPDVSAMLSQVASDVGGRLAGFEHRLKTRASLLRKMRKMMQDEAGMSPSDLHINDSLRYTIEVDDVPPGRHVEAIRTALARLEVAGHRVARVKNYWPPGDNYSGVNSVIIAPEGLAWELQFHTADSFRIKMRDYHLYEELREVKTPAARKRQLYDELAAPWESVPIPRHVLDPKALHRTEEIIRQTQP